MLGGRSTFDATARILTVVVIVARGARAEIRQQRWATDRDHQTSRVGIVIQ